MGQVLGQILRLLHLQKVQVLVIIFLAVVALTLLVRLSLEALLAFVFPFHLLVALPIRLPFAPLVHLDLPFTPLIHFGLLFAHFRQ
jgi:hypothetical protein